MFKAKYIKWPLLLVFLGGVCAAPVKAHNLLHPKAVLISNWSPYPNNDSPQNKMLDANGGMFGGGSSWNPQTPNPVGVCSFPDRKHEEAPGWICGKTVDGYVVLGLGKAAVTSAGEGFAELQASVIARHDLFQHFKVKLQSSIINAVLTNVYEGQASYDRAFSELNVGLDEQAVSLDTHVVHPLRNGKYLYVLLGLSTDQYRKLLEYLFANSPTSFPFKEEMKKFMLDDTKPLSGATPALKLNEPLPVLDYLPVPDLPKPKQKSKPKPNLRHAKVEAFDNASVFKMVPIKKKPQSIY